MTAGRITFGVHKGLAWTDVPIQYLNWIAATFKSGAIRNKAIEVLGDDLMSLKKKKSRGLGSEDCSAPESSLVSFVMPNGQMTKIPAGWSVGDVEEEAPF